MIASIWMAFNPLYLPSVATRVCLSQVLLLCPIWWQMEQVISFVVSGVGLSSSNKEENHFNFFWIAMFLDVS